MADGVKTYQIKINGLQESISAVESLNNQLSQLDKQIKAVENKVVNVYSKSSGGGSKSSSTSSLSEEEKLEKQISQIEEKRVAYGKQIYQDYLAQKDLLKEQVNDQKTIAASERQMANSYSNTIQGMKQELADIKTVMQTVDLGDTGQFDKLVQRANELNNKLKEIEQSYGQFGRNVGNYASAADGFQKISINVGGTVREFNNAREASRTLNNELKTMAVNGQTDTDEFKNLRQAVMQMESAMNDAKKPMDDLMDAMESFTAIASVGEGISALFGIDDSEIQRSIQKLLALQNVLKGIETINKQMQTGEGIGSWLSKGSEMADKLAASIVGVGKASKGATVATKALGTALKALGIGLLIAAVAELINLFETWSDNQRKAAEEAEAAAEKVKKAIDEQRQAYVSASAAYMNTASRLSYLRTEYKNTNDELRKTNIIKEASAEFKKLGINVKSVTDAQRIFVEDGDKVIQLLKLQGDAAAIAALRMEAFKKSFQMLLENGYDANSASILAGYNKTVLELDKRLGTITDQVNNLKGKLKIGDYSTQIENGGKKTAAAIKKVDDELTQLRIANMKEGLNKVLKQLEEERKQRLAKLETNDRQYEEKKAEINKLYDGKILEAKKNWAKEVEKTYKSMWDNIYSYSIETASKIVNLNELTDDLNKGAFNHNKGADFINSKSGTTYGIQGSNQLSKGSIAELELEEEVNKDIKEVYQNRTNIIRQHWKVREKVENDGLDAIFESQTNLENKRYEKERRDNKSHYDSLVKQLDENLDKQKITRKEYDELIERGHEEFAQRDEIIEKTHVQNLDKIEREREDKVKKNKAEYYQEELQEMRDFQTAINNLENSLPVYNSLGLINLSETKKNNKELLDSYTVLAANILAVKKKLKKDLEKGKISFDDFQSAIRELNALLQQLGIKAQETKKKLSFGNQLSEFLQSAEVYIQAGVQAFNQIMDAAFDAWNNAIDKEQEQLDKENEMLDEKLDEQEEIIEEHKNNVDSIEDELATARGDRRQHLIDQLNAEITAQRTAEAEKKRIQKEQEANEKKQDALEKKRKKLQYKQQLLQAIVNGAMSITYAAMNSWPVPAIPLMAAAGAATAAQIAIMSANKPYAKGGQLDGGVAVGNRHRDGGIKVLGGRAEIEGGEFITNRISTQMNAPLLEFINSKKKKIDASDLIEFYSSGSVKRNLSNVKTKFEDGGYIPQLPNSLDIRDQLQNVIINQDNRPIYVSVVDINNKQEQVRRVQTLAGLSD